MKKWIQLIGDAQTPILTPTEGNSSVKFVEQFTKESIYAKYGTGDYYMKTTMKSSEFHSKFLCKRLITLFQSSKRLQSLTVPNFLLDNFWR